MITYAIAFLGIIVIILWLHSKTSKIIYIKRLILPAGCIAFILLLMIFSKTAVASAVKGINLWLNIVFPSLFPFFVASELLNGTGFIRAAGILLEPIMRPLFNIPGSGSFAVAIGITSGYPVGAKITVGLRKEKLLTKIEAERLLAFSNNSGPLFIIGAVAVGMFNMPEIGTFLLICHIAAGLTVGFLFRFYKRGSKHSVKPASSKSSKLINRLRNELFEPGRKPKAAFGKVFGKAITNSINTILAIGGFIVIFSVIISLLLEVGFISYLSDSISFLLTPLGIHKDLIYSSISGFFEITTGTDMASQASGAPLTHQLTAAALIIGWAGMSVHSQVSSIISSTDISPKPYLLGKLLQGIIAAIYTYLGIKLLGRQIFTSQPAFSQLIPDKTSSWQNYFVNSFQYLLMGFAIIAAGIVLSLILSFISSLLRKARC